MSTSPAVDDVDGEPASALGAAGKFGEAEDVAHPTATSRPAATATIRQARSHRPRRRREKAEVRWDICEELAPGACPLDYVWPLRMAGRTCTTLQYGRNAGARRQA